MQLKRSTSALEYDEELERHQHQGKKKLIKLASKTHRIKSYGLL
jgi:hypothetical protein